jgi:hypothetical protein
VAKQVPFVERIGNFQYLETFTLIYHFYSESTIARLGDYMNLFIPVVTVPVYNRIDHAFSHGHAYAMLLVFIESGLTRGPEDFRFGMIHAFERGRILSIKQYFRAGFHRFSIRRQLNKRA